MSVTGWRLMVKADLPAVEELHRKQQEMIGFEYELPNFFGSPVMIAVVHETAGVLDYVLTLEAHAELMAIGTGPLPVSEMAAVTEQLSINMRARGIHLVRAQVPNGLLAEEGKKRSPIERLLRFARFSQERELTTFWKRL